MSSNLHIVPYSQALRSQILDVWERSVLATHHFLSKEDFDEIKSMVATIDFGAFTVHCLLDTNKVVGFIGLTDQKIEMLFLDPEYIGKGLGKTLMKFALDELRATEVDVNEQNYKAVAFYEKFRFSCYERSAKDSEGRNYPILKMKLQKNES